MKSKKPANTLRMISWNAQKKNVISSLDQVFGSISDFKLLVVSETNCLQDLSVQGLIGWRHSREILRGLCVYVSTQLQPYATIKESRYALHGTIKLPTVDNYDPVTIGFVGTYRSPSITTREDILAYLQDIRDCTESALRDADLVYLMGDLNMYKHRYSKAQG